MFWLVLVMYIYIAVIAVFPRVISVYCKLDIQMLHCVAHATSEKLVSYKLYTSF